MGNVPSYKVITEKQWNDMTKNRFCEPHQSLLRSLSSEFIWRYINTNTV